MLRVDWPSAQNRGAQNNTARRLHGKQPTTPCSTVHVKPNAASAWKRPCSPCSWIDQPLRRMGGRHVVAVLEPLSCLYLHSCLCANGWTAGNAASGGRHGSTRATESRMVGVYARYILLLCRSRRSLLSIHFCFPPGLFILTQSLR